jgi:hypothetical protein
VDNEVEITEIHDMDVTRQDAVVTPASGFTFLIKKSAAADAPESESAVEDATKDAPVTPAESAPAETSEVEDAAKSAPVAPVTVEKAVFDALAERVEKMESALAEANVRATVAEVQKDAAVNALKALEATPLPGGPVLAATEQDKAFKARAEASKQAAYWTRMAEVAPTQETRMEYSNRAKVAKAKAE